MIRNKRIPKNRRSTIHTSNSLTNTPPPTTTSQLLLYSTHIPLPSRDYQRHAIHTASFRHTQRPSTRSYSSSISQCRLPRHSLAQSSTIDHLTPMSSPTESPKQPFSSSSPLSPPPPPSPSPPPHPSYQTKASGKRHTPLGSVRISPDYCFEYPENTKVTMSSMYMLESLEDTELFATALADALPSHQQTNILLYGDIGTGKTTLSKSLLRTLTQSPMLTVTSPTFTLQMIYRHGNREYRHYDLYRLKCASETSILGLKESYQSSNDNTATTTNPSKDPLQSPPSILNLIEWPHILHHTEFMPPSYIRIDITDYLRYKIATISFIGDAYPLPDDLPFFSPTTQHDSLLLTVDPTRHIRQRSAIQNILESLEMSGVARVSPSHQVLYQYLPDSDGIVEGVLSAMSFVGNIFADSKAKRPKKQHIHRHVDDIDENDGDYDDDYHFKGITP